MLTLRFYNTIVVFINLFNDPCYCSNSKSNSQMFIFSINILICMSFSFLLEGYIEFNNYLKKLNLIILLNL